MGILSFQLIINWWNRALECVISTIGQWTSRNVFFVQQSWKWYSLQGTNISRLKSLLKMIFLFPRWDMLIPRRVVFTLRLANVFQNSQGYSLLAFFGSEVRLKDPHESLINQRVPRLGGFNMFQLLWCSSRYLGKWSQFDEHIFQFGWYQLVLVFSPFFPKHRHPKWCFGVSSRPRKDGLVSPPAQGRQAADESQK